MTNNNKQIKSNLSRFNESLVFGMGVFCGGNNIGQGIGAMLYWFLATLALDSIIAFVRKKFAK